MLRTRCLMWIWASGAALTTGTVSAQVEVPPAEALLPDTTTGFLAVTDYQVLERHWGQTQLGELMADLRALAPVISALGGSEAVGETFRAIQDVGRWWP